MIPDTVRQAEAVDRRVLVAERDAARGERILQDVRAELARTELTLKLRDLEVEEYLRQIGRLEDILDVLYDTPSWRWTAPLRRASNFVARLRASMGGPPPAVLPGPRPPADPAPEPQSPLSAREQAILHRLRRNG